MNQRSKTTDPSIDTKKLQRNLATDLLSMSNELQNIAQRLSDPLTAVSVSREEIKLVGRKIEKHASRLPVPSSQLAVADLPVYYSPLAIKADLTPEQGTQLLSVLRKDFKTFLMDEGEFTTTVRENLTRVFLGHNQFFLNEPRTTVQNLGEVIRFSIDAINTQVFKLRFDSILQLEKNLRMLGLCLGMKIPESVLPIMSEGFRPLSDNFLRIDIHKTLSNYQKRAIVALPVADAPWLTAA